MRVGRRIALGLFAATLAVSGTRAQTGGLRFRVVETKTGAPIPGIQITLANDLRAIASTTRVTDARGEALFPVLPARGLYTAEIYVAGYQRTRFPDIRVETARTQRVVIQLFRERQEVVEVKGERPVVELAETASSSRFSGEFLQDLPIQGRLYQNMLTFAPGVLDADEDGNPNVHGARDRDFKTVVAGVSNQDPLTGQLLGQVSLDSVEEIEVITAGAGVEYGRAQGGFANVVQKQGSNDFEEVASFYYRSDKLDGNGASNIPRSQLPEFGWLQPAFQVTGPILRDRFWYRFTHEVISEDRPVNVIGGLAVTTRRQEIHDDQLTWQVSPRNKLVFQYRRTPIVLDRFGVSSLIPPESTVRIETGGPTYSLTWTAPQSPRLLLESQAAYQDAFYHLLPSSDGEVNRCVSGFAPLDRAQCTDEKTGSVSGSPPIVWRDRRQRFTARGSGTFHAGRHWGMTHRLKFGLQVENERYFRLLDQGPSFLFTIEELGVTVGPDGKANPIRFGSADTMVALPKVSTARATGTSWGLYTEDEMRLGRSLSLRLGARLDQEYVDSNGFHPFDAAAEAAFFAAHRQNTGTGNEIADAEFNRVLLLQVFTAYEGLQGQGSLSEQFQQQFGITLALSPLAAQSTFWSKTRRPENIHLVRTNFAPRLALSWDPWSDGKTKFWLTAGRYYDKIFLAVPTLELPPVTLNLLFYAKLEGLDRWAARPDRGAVNPASSVRMVDRGLRTPFQDEVTIGFERELPVPETSIRLEYVRRRFEDQLQDVDINHVPANVPGPGGLPDLYALNPAWGRILLVGNSNSAEYGAYVLELTRRHFQNWQLQGSYAYSRAIGDAEDFLGPLGDDRSRLEDERGYLSYDVRHFLKLNWTARVPWLGGLRLGTAISWQSGLPYSVLEHRRYRFIGLPIYGGLGAPDPVTRTIYVTGQRNDQRNPAYWNVDVRVAKEIELQRGRSLQLTAEVFNLLNDDALVIWNPFLRYGQIIGGRMDATRRFGRQFQVGFRLAF